MFLLFLLIVTLVLATCHWYYKRRRLPPGPPAVPLLGSLPFLDLRRGLTDWSTDPIVTRHSLATVTLGPENIFVINDLKLARELFEKDEFSARHAPEWMKLLRSINGKLRGIVATKDDDWSKQRMFGLKTLRDLGFGRRTIEELVDREIDEITSKLASHTGQDFLLGSDFSIPVINVLWQLVASYRFDEKMSQDRDIVNDIERILESFMFLSTIPISISKVFRKKYFEKNLRMVRNHTNYIIGK